MGQRHQAHGDHADGGLQGGTQGRDRGPARPVDLLRAGGAGIRDYSQIPTNVVFIENLKKIRKSRVYYSFLSESEKKDLERGKTL